MVAFMGCSHHLAAYVAIALVCLHFGERLHPRNAARGVCDAGAEGAPSDMGSSNYGGDAAGLGVPPLSSSAPDSIDQRQRRDEWFVQEYLCSSEF